MIRFKPWTGNQQQRSDDIVNDVVEQSWSFDSATITPTLNGTPNWNPITDHFTILLWTITKILPNTGDAWLRTSQSVSVNSLYNIIRAAHFINCHLENFNPHQRHKNVHYAHYVVRLKVKKNANVLLFQRKLALSARTRRWETRSPGAWRINYIQALPHVKHMLDKAAGINM